MTLYDYWSPAGRTKHTYVRLAIVIHCQSLAFFKFVNGILRNWESLCDIRPDCHHHFDVSRFSGKVSDESLGRDEAYVCKASHNYSLFSNWTIKFWPVKYFRSNDKNKRKKFYTTFRWLHVIVFKWKENKIWQLNIYRVNVKYASKRWRI